MGLNQRVEALEAKAEIPQGQKNFVILFFSFHTQTQTHTDTHTQTHTHTHNIHDTYIHT